MRKLRTGSRSLGIEHGHRAVNAVRHVDRAAVMGHEHDVRAAPGADLARDVPVRRVDDGDIVAAHDPDQQLAVVPEHARGRLAHLAVPQHGARPHVDRNQAVGRLQADVHHAGVGRVVDVAGHPRRRHPMGELERRPVVDIDLVASQPGHCQPFAVRTEHQLIRIGHRHSPHQLAARRVQEQQFVAGRVADQQELVVGRERQVMRLAQHRDLAQLGVGAHIQHGDGRVGRVQDESRARRGCGLRSVRDHGPERGPEHGDNQRRDPGAQSQR